MDANELLVLLKIKQRFFYKVLSIWSIQYGWRKNFFKAISVNNCY